ncbi:MAG: hypothetical protein K8H88_13610 [Sandaracinaceae bacterium]|nr:hypothetical protein [Sandaracinaceae bacterium]
MARRNALLLAIALLIVACSPGSIDIGSLGLDEPTIDPLDARVLIAPTDGSPGVDQGAITSTMDAVLDRAAHAPGSRVRAWAMVESGPPVLLLDVTTPALPAQPRRRERRVDAYVIEERERLLDALAPYLANPGSRRPIAESIARIAAEDAVGDAEVHVVAITDLRESVLGNYARRATTPTVRQTLSRAAARRLFEPGSLTGIAVHVAGFRLLPGRRRPLDCSLAQQARLEERFHALFERAGASSIEFATGAPRFDLEDASEEEE